MNPPRTTIKEIFKEISKEEVMSIKQIVGKGDVNQVFIIKTNKNKVLLRLNKERDEFVKEKWCIDKAKKKGVPGPEIIKIGRFGEWAYMAYKFIEGKSGKEIKTDKSEIWRKLGEYGKKINSIKTKGYGDKINLKTKRFSGNWKKFINYNIKSLNKEDELIKLKVYNEKQLPMIKDSFTRLKLKKHKFGLVHNDLYLGNIIIDKNKNFILIDWGCAESNIIPYGEFVEVLGYRMREGKDLNSENFNDFLKGYGLRKSQYVKIEKEISSFLLLVSFDKLRWAIDKAPSEIKNHTKTAKRRLNYAFKKLK